MRMTQSGQSRDARDRDDNLLARARHAAHDPVVSAPLPRNRRSRSLEGNSPVVPTLDQVQAIMDRRGPGGMVASDPIWPSGFRINEGKVSDYRSGRVFVAGDAAHVHSPVGGPRLSGIICSQSPLEKDGRLSERQKAGLDNASLASPTANTQLALFNAHLSASSAGHALGG